MGRYTTVQAYADNNPSMRTVGYEQTALAAQKKTDGSSSSSKKPPTIETEKVDNPYGSTAGAGSGEFHTYRHARARENARLAELDRVEAEQEADAKWKEKLEGWKVDDEMKAAKRRRKRERAKEAKMRKKIMKMNGVEMSVGERREDGDDGKEEEFEYAPVYKANDQKAEGDKEEKGEGEGEEKTVGEGKSEGKDDHATTDDLRSKNDKGGSRRKDSIEDNKAQSTVMAPPFTNDGSFLEMMKRQMSSQVATGD